MKNQYVTWPLLVLLGTGLAVSSHGQVLASNQAAQQPGNKIAPVNAQQTSLRTVLHELETRFRVSIAYRSELLDQRTIYWERGRRFASLEKALAAALAGQSLRVEKVSEGFYVLSEPPSEPEKKRSGMPESRRLDRPESDFRGLLALSRLQPVVPTTLAFADVILTGRVTDETGAGLPAVNISVKNTQRGTTTDGTGTYRLAVPDASAVLVFSSVGYERQEVTVGTRSTIDVVLKSASGTLDEVVVVGYGTQQKRDLTGAVSSIAAAELKEVPVLRVEQMLQGRAAGVQVTQVGAQPGGNVSIRIRGTNSINSGNEPLFVIDGFPGVGSLNSINPNDIESIEILKDASATAIYGSRGANGVVLITTKRGKAGQNFVDVEVYRGVNTLRRKLDLLNATEYATYLNEAYDNLNRFNNTKTPLPFTPAQISALGEGTDWQDEVYRSAALANYQVSLRGGNANTRYALSAGYYTEQGIVINSRYQRANLRLNLDHDVSKRVKVGTSLLLARTKSNNTLINTIGGSAGGVVLDAFRFSPTTPVYNTDGNYTFLNQPQPYVDLTGNPVAYANLAKNDGNLLRGTINSYVNYEILNGLTLRVTGGVDFRHDWDNVFTPASTFLGSQQGGSARKTTATNYSWLNENTLTYDASLGQKHRLTLLGGFTIQEFKNEGYTAAASSFFTDNLGENNLGIGGNVLTPTSSASRSRLASFIVRSNYKFADKYLLTLTGRADGSSKFGPSNKWGYFPSAAFAWRISEEPFVQNLTLFSDLKLRTSYGVTGNQEIASYQSLTRYAATSYVLGGNRRVVGVFGANIPNPDIRWERTASFDVGLDVAFFKDRLSLTADYYDKKTTDLLLSVSLPRSSGFGSVTQNIGSVGNKGIELSLNADVLTGPLEWTASANFTANRNRVLDLGPELQRFVGNTSSSIFPGVGGNAAILRVGEPIGSFYGYVFDGIYQTQEEINAAAMKFRLFPGDPRYADLNGDKLINGSDRTIIGRALPKFSYGFTNRLAYRGLELTAFVQGVYGNNVLNLNRYDQEVIVSANKTRNVLNRWTGPGTSNTLPIAGSTLRRTTGLGSDVVEDGSYLRLKTITLGYSLPTSWLQKVKVRSLKVYVTGQNLLTLTNYTGYDPEVNSFGTDNLSLGTDYGAYPTSKTVMVGINAGF
jgi:TonB-linked SusC/RagA family outer membrane protein